MVFLILNILANTLIFVIFKLFYKYQVENDKAIVINYFVAHLLGMLLAGTPTPEKIIHAPWLWIAFVEGILFISLFNLMALTAQQLGLSVASVSNKMSLILPTIMAMLLYNEAAHFTKIAGIILAAIAVILINLKEQHNTIQRKQLLWPLILFVGSGFIDIFITVASKEYIQYDSTAFTSIIFLIAGLIGLIRLIVSKDYELKLKTVFAGLILGIVNFFSIYLLVLTLEKSGMESSRVIPINNMGIVALSALVALFFFKERLNKFNWLGILVSLLAIYLIAFS